MISSFAPQEQIGTILVGCTNDSGHGFRWTSIDQANRSTGEKNRYSINIAVDRENGRWLAYVRRVTYCP